MKESRVVCVGVWSIFYVYLFVISSLCLLSDFLLVALIARCLQLLPHTVVDCLAMLVVWWVWSNTLLTVLRNLAVNVYATNYTVMSAACTHPPCYKLRGQQFLQAHFAATCRFLPQHRCILVLHFTSLHCVALRCTVLHSSLMTNFVSPLLVLVIAILIAVVTVVVPTTTTWRQRTTVAVHKNCSLQA